MGRDAQLFILCRAITCEDPLDMEVENRSDGKKRVKRELQETQ